MEISKYNIKLSRLSHEDLELVRSWRNSELVRSRMAYQQFISQSEQEKWFYSINNECNFYFIISVEDQKIGLINTKNIDWKNKWGEGGIFIGVEEYIETYIPTLASLCLLEFVFEVLNGIQYSFIRILKDNKRAISYNKNLGYLLLPAQENIDNQLYMLTKENYFARSEKLKRAAALVSLSREPLQYSGIENVFPRELSNALFFLKD